MPWNYDYAAGCCPACGEAAYLPLFRSSDSLYRTTTEWFLVVRCGVCGLIRLTPPIPPDHLPRYYPNSYWFVPDAFSAFETAYRRFVLRDHIRFTMQAYRRAGSSGVILDAGCGGGLFLAMLPKSVRVCGMDISFQAASSARAVNSVAAFCGTLDHAPLASASCSVITMFHVIEHLSNPVSHLRSARRLLRRGGRLVVQVPNADSWQFHLFRRRWNGIDVPRHLVNYRTQDLVRLLAASGFRVQRVRHFNLRDNPAGFATSLAPSLDPMARRLSGRQESRAVRLLKSVAYLCLTIAAVPFAVAEAIFQRGSSIMIEASVDDSQAH